MNVKTWIKLKTLEKVASAKNDALMGALVGGTAGYGGAKAYNKMAKTLERLVNANEKAPKAKLKKINTMLAMGGGAASGAAIAALRRKIIERKRK